MEAVVVVHPRHSPRNDWLKKEDPPKGETGASYEEAPYETRGPWASKRAPKRRYLKTFLDFRFLRLGGVLASDSLEKWTNRWENIRARSPKKLVYVAPQETRVLRCL